MAGEVFEMSKGWLSTLIVVFHVHRASVQLERFAVIEELCTEGLVRNLYSVWQAPKLPRHKRVVEWSYLKARFGRRQLPQATPPSPLDSDQEPVSIGSAYFPVPTFH